MKKFLQALVLAASTFLLTSTALAREYQVNGLTIRLIRVVGQYEDPTYRNTIELYFTDQLTLPNGAPCTDTSRVYIDANNYHLVAAAYTAFYKARRINISFNDNLPRRNGACEVSFIDLLPA